MEIPEFSEPISMNIPKRIRSLFPVALSVFVTGCFPYHATTRMGFSGTVVDAETHAPLANAFVSFIPLVDTTNEPMLVISAADGSFTVARKKQWQIRFIAGDYLDQMIGGTVGVQHDGYETNSIDVKPLNEDQRFHTQAHLGIIPLKPLSQTH